MNIDNIESIIESIDVQIQKDLNKFIESTPNVKIDNENNDKIVCVTSGKDILSFEYTNQSEKVISMLIFKEING